MTATLEAKEAETDHWGEALGIYDRVRGLALKHSVGKDGQHFDAQDFLQAGLIGAYRAAGRFDPARSRNKERYMLIAAGNAMRDMEREWLPLKRKQAAEPDCPRFYSLDFVRPDPSDDGFPKSLRDRLPDPTSREWDPPLWDELAPARRGLPWRTRVLMWLAWVEGWSQRDAGRAVGVTESRANQLLREARDWIRGYYERSGGVPVLEG